MKLTKIAIKGATKKLPGGKHKLVKSLPKKYEQDKTNLHIHERNKALGSFDARPGTVAFKKIMDAERQTHKLSGEMYSASDDTAYEFAMTSGPNLGTVKTKKGKTVNITKEMGGSGMDMFGVKYGYPVDGQGNILRHLAYSEPQLNKMQMDKQLKKMGFIP